MAQSEKLKVRSEKPRGTYAIASNVYPFPTGTTPTFTEGILTAKGSLVSGSLNAFEQDLARRVAVLETKPTTLGIKIYDLDTDKFVLTEPVDVVLTVYPDEVLARIPDLEIYGEGTIDSEAISDLKLELIDLYEDLNNTLNEKLGKKPRAWKRIINQLVRATHVD